MNSESCEHEIEISEQMTVQLKIPKRLTVLEFLGLTKQAEVLMKAAQKDVMPEAAPRRRIRSADWTDERVNKLKETFNKLSNEEILKLPEFAGFEEQQLKNKAYSLGLKKNGAGKQHMKKMGQVKTK